MTHDLLPDKPRKLENKWVQALALGECVALWLLWHLSALARVSVAPSIVKTSPSASPHNSTSTHSPFDASQETDRPVFIKDVYEPGHLWPHPELCGARAGAGAGAGAVAGAGAGVELLVLVTSAPEHERARQAVRLTWKQYAQRRDVVIAFVLGRAPPPLMEQVAKEDALYGDIIMGASWDTYRNLTLKTLSLLDWAGTYCPRARHLLKTDDDMFINVPRLLALLALPARAHNTTTIWGRILRNYPPCRDPKSKAYLSLKQFPGKVLPDFTNGAAYALSSEAAARLRAAAPDHLFIPLEDVCFTGLLALRLHLHLEHIPEFYNRQMSLDKVQSGVSIHDVTYHKQFDFWKKLHV